MSRLRDLYQRIRTLKWISPGSFLLCAITFAGVFALLHLAGLRSRTSIFCGTLPAGYDDQVVTGFLAVLYTVFYMAAVIAAPILALGAGILRLLMRLQSRPGRLQSQPEEGGSVP